MLGATGGVGSAGVQIGRAMGARVIAVVSRPEQAARIGALRADHVVALSGRPLAEQVRGLTGGRGAEAVLDPIGGEATGKALSAIDRTFPLAEVAEATRHLDERRAVGKVVLTL